MGAAAGLGLVVAKHDSDLLADLVVKMTTVAGLGDDRSELAEGGAHEAGLGADVAVAISPSSPAS